MSKQPEAGPLGTIPADLFSVLEEKSIMHLGTRDAALHPTSTLAFGIQVAPGTRNEITVFLPAALAEPTMTNLRDTMIMNRSAAFIRIRMMVMITLAVGVSPG